MRHATRGGVAPGGEVPDALVVAARHGLPVRDLRSPPPPVDLRVTALAASDGLVVFLADAVAAGLLTADEAVAAAVRDRSRVAVTTSLAIEAMLVRTAVVLDAAAVRWRLTKGPAVAHLDYRSQTTARTFRDLDLVVHPDDWDAALVALTDDGFHRRTAELRPGYDARFGKGATMISAGGCELDLHRRLSIGRFGLTADVAALFDTEPDVIEIGERSIPALDDAGRLLHACHHLVLGGASGLRAARDVAQLVLATGADWHRTVEISEAWRCDAVVARAITIAWSRLRLSEPHGALAWAARHRIRRRDRRAMAVFERGRSFRRQALTGLAVVAPTTWPTFLRCHLGGRDGGDR